jgi:polyhydroxybutyrate depolymerase
LTIESGGRSREFRLYVPASADLSGPVPLVLNFHGLGSNAPQQEAYSDLVNKAASEGFITAAGQGIRSSWNAGEICCPPARDEGVDDVQFARDMVARIAQDYCIDVQRIYSTGMSNGGFMSNRLACDAADLFAAVAPVASLLGVSTCEPTRPMPILMFNGTEDALVPYAGATGSFARWALLNGCEGEPEVTFENGDSRCESYLDCAEGATTTLCTVQGGRHTWPGSPLGHTTTDLIASDAMWEFFLAHPLP